MASRYYGVDRGVAEQSVAEGSTFTGKDVELVVDLAVSLEKSEVILAIAGIIEKMLSGNWPPAATTADNYAWGSNRGSPRDVTPGAPVFASGTITAASVLEGDTVTVQGAVLTAQDLREKFTVLCVADSAGSLNNKYFTFSKSGTDYYVWFNVNSAGTDPLLAGKTAVPVALATNASNTTVATAVQVAIDALAGVTATVASATVTVVIDAIGSVTDAAQGAVSTGFTITVTRQGAAAPGTDKFAMNTDDTATALSLVAAILANATSAAVVTAVSALGVVTITALEAGTVGNAYTLATSNNTRLAKSGATLASGAEGATGKNVRATVEMDKSISRDEAMIGLTFIKNYVLKGNWPPA